MTLSLSQLQSQGNDLELRLKRFEADYEDNPRLSERQKEAAWKTLKADYETWKSNKARLQSIQGSASYKKLLQIGHYAGTLGNTTTMNDATYPLGATGVGRDVYPFGLPKDEVRKAYEVIKRGGNYIIAGKDFSSSVETKATDGSGNPFTTVDSLLVPQQAPGIVPEYFEARLLDHLPVTTISAPSYQFLQHQYASDTGSPGFVAEGQTKPQWNPSAEKVIVTAQKLAGYFDISSESIMDAPQWESYLINTLFQLIMQKENTAILYGTVTSNLGIQGWSTQTGVLTHNASADPAGSTNLDSIELAIKQLRVQSGVFAVPNLCIMSPATFSATRRIKSTTGEYIAGNPLNEPVTHVWGIPVVVTTAANDGDCFLVDTSKMGSVLVRQGIETHMGYAGEGLINNILTVVAEERLTLATVIPSAVNYVTNLAVA